MSDTKSRLVRFFEKYNPSNIANIDKVMAAYAGKEDQLWAALTQKYGPEPAFAPGAASGGSGDTRARLVRFFEKYNPANVANVDKVLAAYAGKEDQLWGTLTQKYGPEPGAGASSTPSSPATSPRGPAASAGGNDTKARLTRFFQKYNPSNIANIDKVMASYAGKEDQLWAALIQKYGPEPAPGESAQTTPSNSPRTGSPNDDTRARLVRFFEKYNPSNVANVDKVMAAYAGKEDQLWSTLTQKYGPEPGAGASSTPSSPATSPRDSGAAAGGNDTRARLTRFFQKYNPSNVANIDKVMAAYAGKEDQLWSSLIQKYGPEPTAGDGAAASAPAPSTSSSGLAMDTKSRLVRFFQKYNPANVANIDKVMAAYAGKEDQLWASLIQKYGPEPAAEVAGGGAAAAASPPAMDTKSRLTRFFQKYNPSNIANIDKVMAAYAGKEDQLWASLVQKYGPEPIAESADTPRSVSGATGSSATNVLMDTKSRLTRFFQKYNPANVANIDKVMAAYAGKEDQLWASLIQKYGPEPAVEEAGGSRSASGASGAGAPMDTKSRLVRFFQKYNPSNVANIDKVMAAYAGKEDQLWASLVQKYGPEPIVETPDASRSVSGASAGSAGVPMDTKSRLVRFFQKYNPANVANIDKVMAAYAGKEDQLWASLVQKYGPEPAVEVAGGGAGSTGTTPNASRSVSNVPATNAPQASAGPSYFSLTADGLYRPPVKPLADQLEMMDALDVIAQLPVATLVAQLQNQVGPFPKETDAFWQEYLASNRSVAAVGIPVQQQQQQQQQQQSAAAPSGGNNSNNNNTRERLVKFFEKYNPSNIANIDKVMAAYRGKEDQLWDSLVQKYGPEVENARAAPPPPTSSSGPAMDTKSRLVRFFQKYNPANVANIDKVMAAYAGKEDQLWASLIQKYGPEPVVGGAATSAASAGGNGAPAMDTKSRLTRFFQKYNPANVANIDKVMAAYAGKEDQLWASLIQKYGPEPAVEEAGGSRSASGASGAGAPMDTKSRLVRFFQKYNPSNVANIDKVMAAYAGKEDQLWSTLVQKYGPEPPADASDAGSRSASGTTVVSTVPSSTASVPMDTKSRLTRFFQKYNPANVSNIDKVMAAYAGKEDQLWASLIQKYGPEPIVETPDASRSVSGASAGSAGVPMDTKSRLVRFFQKYNPANVANIDKVMAAYAGKEDQLWASLVQKYGPEPVAAADTPPVSRSVSQQSAPPPGLSTSTTAPSSPQYQQQQNQQAQPPRSAMDIAKLKGYIAKHFASSGAKKVTLANFLVTALGNEQAVSNFIASSYVADNSLEGRVQRIISKHNPEKLLATDLVEECVRSVRQADGDTRVLARDFGGEPQVAPAKAVQNVPISTLDKVDFFELDALAFAPGAPLESFFKTSAARKAPAASPAFLRHRNFNFKFAEDEVADGAERQIVDASRELDEGAKITEDAKETEAGNVSGDEAKTYPEEDEFWVRLSFRDAGVRVVQKPTNSARSRTFTEFQGTPGSEGAAAKPPVASPRKEQLVAAEVDNSAGENIINDGALCTNCSGGIQKAFRALWTSVGQRHRQMLMTSQMKTGWVEKLTSGRFRTTFQKRFFKVNDKGLHYFMTEDPTEKAKGHKHFTEQSGVIANPDQARFPQVADDGYYYFAITVNLNNENYLLRVPTKQEKDEWVTFIKEAIERLKLTTMVGHDPNPGRWRARYSGLRELQAAETSKTATMVERSAIAGKERDRLKLDLLELKNEVTTEEQQVEDLKEQSKILRSRIDAANAEHKRKIDTLERAKVDAEAEKKRMDHRTVELEQEQRASHALTDSVRGELIRIRLQIAEEEDTQQNLHARLKKLEAKRRQTEERRPTDMVNRSLTQTGLAYRPPGSAPLHSSHMSAMELQSTKEAREKIVDKLVTEAKERKERARVRMENASSARNTSSRASVVGEEAGEHGEGEENKTKASVGENNNENKAATPIKQGE